MARNALLVVDADPATARRARRALEGIDLEVRVAGSLQEALAAAGVEGLVAVFAAISLTGGSGYELARRLRKEVPGLAVFLLTGGFDVLDEGRARQAGVRGSLRRPLSNDAILASLETVLGAVPVAPADLQPMDEGPVNGGPDGAEESLPVGSIEPLEVTGPAPVPEADALVPLVGNERLATFVPADHGEVPVVRIDREEVSVALERAVLAVLPEVVEAVIGKALESQGRLRRGVEAAVERCVAEALPAAVERALRQRLGEQGD